MIFDITSNISDLFRAVFKQKVVNQTWNTQFIISLPSWRMACKFCKSFNVLFFFRQVFVTYLFLVLSELFLYINDDSTNDLGFVHLNCSRKTTKKISKNNLLKNNFGFYEELGKGLNVSLKNFSISPEITISHFIAHAPDLHSPNSSIRYQWKVVNCSSELNSQIQILCNQT